MFNPTQPPFDQGLGQAPASFKLSRQAPPNYFHLAIIILLAAGVALLAYVSYVLTVFHYEELGLSFLLSGAKKTSLELVSSRSQVQPGETIKVKVLLKTELEKTQGVDILLKYDTKSLALLTTDGQKQDFSKETGSVKVEPLKYLNTQESSFDVFPYFSVNPEQGLISFSALAKPLQEIKGDVEVTSLNFQALKRGETSLNFVFAKGETDDTNVAYLGKDVLAKVKGLKIIVKQK